MATSSFRSKSRRPSISNPDEPGSVRRSRSLSRYSGRFPPPSPEIDDLETPRGRFVNKVRGSGFDISLDDLADEFFRAMGKECEEDGIATPAACRSRERLMAETESSRRRGRSVSRHRGDGAVLSSGSLRPRRSVSVSRSRISELEVDKTDKFRSMSKNRVNSTCGSLKKPSLRCQTSEDHTLGRSMSQKDFFQLHDCDSSHSSSLTDDEQHDVRATVSVSEETIREVFTLGKIDHHTGDGCGFRPHENKSKEQNLVEELRELEKSEKRKLDLLAALAIEEKRGHALRKIVRELLSSPKQVVEPVKSSPSTQSSDKLRISKCLNEEAERYFEDFLSNVEDTDLSSFEGERSDTGSTTKMGDAINNDVGIHSDILRSVSFPAVTDGVIFPWLQWETIDSSSPSPCKTKTATMQNKDGVRGSWSPEGFCEISGGSVNSHRKKLVVPERGCSFDMDECLQLQRRDELLVEMWEQRQRLASGSMVMCGRSPFI